ncbi:hypothetical protein GIB67_002501 [Kingdonia uniflora]|uniref:Major facilitator superfamily (MFS) profile domain-containing protein n=1 Tax=Kingdonia uniflora TaxID=39325 RepID=A0A7J7LAK2_9MAGN|nr:hypothetical protein GIB67_002501 [Kingdonia uniflora]
MPRDDKLTLIGLWSIMMENRYLMRMTFSASVSWLIFGYDSGIYYNTLPLRAPHDAASFRDFGNTTDVSAIGMNFGLIMGSSVFLTKEEYGRKTLFLVSDILFFAGSLFTAVDTKVLFCVGRLFVGAGVGISLTTTTAYISEVSPNRIRGAFISTTFFLFACGQFLSTLVVEASLTLRLNRLWMYGGTPVLALVQFVLMLHLPDSPRFLLGRVGRKEDCEVLLTKLYHVSEFENEAEALRFWVRNEILTEGPVASLGLLSVVFYREPVDLPCMCNLTSNNVVYQGASFDNNTSRWNITDYFYIQTANPFTPGVYLDINLKKKEYHKEIKSTEFSNLAFAGFGLYILSYSSGLGIIPWIISSEIYPLKLRNKCGGIGGGQIYWILYFMTSVFFINLLEAVGSAHIFSLYCLISCVSTFLIYIFVPETKGVWYDNIYEHYNNWRKSERKRMKTFEFWNRSSIQDGGMEREAYKLLLKV